ncbi:dystroglycan-like [Dorcoceras hygrometricum]|uniref:Dystroglycan-like n=1 Tax=Dorcoceras hygrometricum TaxID=472368 RepID=A0A2Z7AAR8_9LAMI|nr:dystroglycan-like [Dorcoceras hygrometricum]
MAASFYSNSVHVDFDSVLALDEPRMVSMFRALVASGLQGFLGCSPMVYEEALVEFFANGRVRDGLVVSTVNGVSVEISEELFAETFELPVDGLGDLSEMPKDAIFDARSIVYLSGEPISLSGRKNQMKFEYRLLCDIMAKAISVKAGSFNPITVEKFSLMTAVVCSIRMNWAKFLFSILKKMVSPGSKQAKGFAIQISLLLATFPSLELDGAEEVTGTAKKKAVSKKRPAADVGAAVPKKKRTFKKKSISSISSLELVEVAEEAIPIQQTDVDATASSVPPVSQDLSAAFADLQANLLEQIFEYQSGLSSKLHKIEQSVCDSLRDQADIFRNLSQGARQEARMLDDVQSIRFNEFRKIVLAQNASIFQGLADVRQEVQAVNAKVDIMASRLNAILSINT